MDPISIIQEYFEIPEIWARVYWQLLLTGPGTIGSFHSNLNMNRQQVYNILDKLIREEFVVTVRNSKRGNIYKSNPPNQIIDRFLHNLELKVHNKDLGQERVLAYLQEALIKNRSPEAVDQSFQGTIIPRERTAAILSDLIVETLRSFKIAVKDYHLGLMNHIYPAITQTLSRKSTSVQLLLDQNFLNPGFQSHLMDGSWFPQEGVRSWMKEGRVQIRLTQMLTQNFFIFDGVSFMLVFSGETDVDFSFICKIDEITRRFSQKFEQYWTNARAIELTEFVAAIPDKKPNV